MPSVEKFRESLKMFQVNEKLVSRISEGYEDIVSKSPKKKKALYFKRAMDLMTEQEEPERLREILEWNACCKGGARLKASRAFAKQNASLSLEEKLERIREVPYMGNPVLDGDGTITLHAVHYSDGEKFLCACPNYNGLKRDYNVSKNYCFCCAGHFKHHYEIMLGVKLKTLEIVSSPLDSDGKNPCVIRFAIL